MRKIQNNLKIKAAVLVKKKKIKIFQSIRFKKLESKQVLVKIYYSGLCGSQIFEINGHRGKDKYIPHMLGHEATGKVINIGSKVKNVKIGDQVFLSWIKTNEIDSTVPKFFTKNKNINAGRITTLSNYSIISSNRVYKMPKEINLREGILLGCALPTGAGMLLNNNKKNKKVLIIGLGGVGTSALLTSIYLKFNNVDVFEINKYKIKHVSTIMSNKKITFFEKFNFLKKNYYDLIIETSGVSKIISSSMQLLNNQGKIIFASHPKFNSKIELDPFDLILGKKISGSWGGGIKFPRDVKNLVKIIKNFKNLEKLFFEKTYSLNKIEIAIKDLQEGRVIRPLIKL